MTIVNKNIPLIHRKEWQMMTPAPVTPSAGSFVVTDSKELDNLALYVQNATTQYLYHHDEDAWVQIPSIGLIGTFGGGACGTRRQWSNTLTANGGTTSTLTISTTISGLCVGKSIRFLSGSNLGIITTITGIIINIGGSHTIQFNTIPNSVVNNDTFTIDTGLYILLNGGTIASGSFKSYDPLTGVISTLSITGLPGSWASEGKMISTSSSDIFASGSTTSATSTTLVNSTKSWLTNKWTNYQVRIISGVGIGQIRTIISNTSTTLTVSTWTITPDNTSIYVIEGNDDYLYLLGNNTVSLYRYSFNSNTWTTLNPTVARGGTLVAGGSANWVQLTSDPNFDDENVGSAGRYIYSFRGGASTLLDRFDIAGGTAGAGTWVNITYVNAVETFTTGSGYAGWGRYIICRKDATNRFFKYSIRGNYLEPLSTNIYPDGTAIIGDKIWVKNYTENDTVKLTWVYSLGNTTTLLHRLLLI